MNTTTNTAASETATRFDLRAASEDMTFGVEIETSGVSQEAVAHRLAAKFGWARPVSSWSDRGFRVTMTDGRSWLVVRDGSIRGAENAEVVSPILKGDADLQLLQEVVRELRAIGCKSSAELGCGIHVHVGVAALGIPAIGRLAKVVAKADAYIRKAVGVSASRAEWCAPLGPGRSGDINPDLLGRARTPEQLAAAWYTGRSVEAASTHHYHDSRYRGLNLHSFFYRPNGGAARGTAEFRYFDGTLHAGEVKSYVQLCLGLVCYAARAKTASSKPMAMTHGRGQLATWRQFMLTLGMVGDHYKTARTLLSARFPQEVRRAVAPVASSTASAEWAAGERPAFPLQPRLGASPARRGAFLRSAEQGCPSLGDRLVEPVRPVATDVEPTGDLSRLAEPVGVRRVQRRAQARARAEPSAARPTSTR